MSLFGQRRGRGGGGREERGEGGRGGEGKKGGGGEGCHIGMTIADGDDCCDSVLLSRTLPCSHL